MWLSVVPVEVVPSLTSCFAVSGLNASKLKLCDLCLCLASLSAMLLPLLLLMMFLVRCSVCLLCYSCLCCCCPDVAIVVTHLLCCFCCSCRHVPFVFEGKGPTLVNVAAVGCRECMSNMSQMPDD